MSRSTVRARNRATRLRCDTCGRFGDECGNLKSRLHPGTTVGIGYVEDANGNPTDKDICGDCSEQKQGEANG